ncbi:hypothetical protein B0H14DRAFT_2626438 [Mycena olivaceomarginata]|nr:hypothetical protein B0H14DRAFT_2626438 [Mycena olivaceomarginata]
MAFRDSIKASKDSSDKNSKFTLEPLNGYAWLKGCQTSKSPFFSVVGFVTQCVLTVGGARRSDRVPLVLCISKSNGSEELGPRRSMQMISITGVGDADFQHAFTAVKLISDFLCGAGSNIEVLPSAVALGGTCGGITANTRVMTPAQHNIFDVAEIPSQLDVHGQVRHWSTDSAARVVYTVDNEVDVMNMIGIEGDSSDWQFDSGIPRSSIQRGNLVEILVSFRVAPFARGVCQVQCHLDRVIKIGSEATSDLSHLDEQAAAIKGANVGQQKMGKQSLPVPFQRVNRQRREDTHMEVDNLTSNVQDLEVGSSGKGY